MILIFSKIRRFYKIEKRKGTKDKILITQSFEDILNWVWKNEENNWNYEDILKTKKIKRSLFKTKFNKRTHQE